MDEVAKRRLLVKGFPDWIRAEDKESLLRHFGAKDVVVMPTKGRMRNTAFAEFLSAEDAQLALQKLHQLELFGCRLAVEFSKPRHTNMMQEAGLDKWKCNTLTLTDHPSLDHPSHEGVTTDAKDSSQASDHPLCHVSSLCYDYPPLNPSILHNIANALACIPKFYTQVLHLMNKLNLPPPFGLPVPAAPLLFEPVVYATVGQRTGEEEEVESELDSDGGKEGSADIVSKPKKTVKRRRPISLKQMQGAPPSSKKRKMTESFEAAETRLQPKKIEIHIPTELNTTAAPQPDVVMEIVTSTRAREHLSTQPAADSVSSMINKGKLLRQELLSTGSHGSSEPVITKELQSHVIATNESTVVQEDQNASRFISQAALDAGRLPQSELEKMSVFKGYTPGEPSMRLYVKNLAKNVTEKDLEYIFGRYVDWSSDIQVQAFDIRVMQSGRLRGQAFIGLPSEQVACQARQDVNGYELQGKPLVVVICAKYCFHGGMTSTHCLAEFCKNN